MQIHLDQEYPSGAVSLGFDLYLPDGVQDPPLVVCIHGGGWISGDRKDYSDVAVTLAEHDFAAACVSYRLAPLHPFPTPVEDVLAFVQFAARQHGLGYDPRRIATLGNSAGGHLAALAGLKCEHVKAVVDICGISDVTDPRTQHFPISWAFLEQFMQVSYEDRPEAFIEASPIHQIGPNPPPFLIIHGEDDDIVPVEQSIRFAAALREAGTLADVHVVKHETHSFSFESWLKIENLFLEFLRAKL